jgi:carboxypeptidase Q
MKKFFFLLLFGIYFLNLNSQTKLDLSEIFNAALKSDIAYNNLKMLCETAPGRISGTAAAAKAVEFSRQIMEEMSLDTVYLQELKVMHWSRGDKEVARIMSTYNGIINLNISALGLSVGTGVRGVTAGVVEVKSIDELKSLGRSKVEGKIVFFNRSFEQAYFNTFRGYGTAVDQRFAGPSEAAELGAVAAIIRSVTSANHDFAHTGVTRLNEEGKNIPAVAVSTVGADILANWLKKDPSLNLYLKTTCELLPEEISYNVIGEIRGIEYPEQIITVGGHLDAWDNSPGAHDNGGGCMQSIEVLRLFRELNIKPKRTIRAVMFMDEEIAQRGGKKYAEKAAELNENHYFAIESDRGVSSPTGFSIDTSDENFNRLLTINEYFEEYGIFNFFRGGSGVDIGFLKEATPEVVLVGLVTDPQRYFDYHHSANDTFDKVNRREMQLGSAAMASIIYLVDRLDLFEKDPAF